MAYLDFENYPSTKTPRNAETFNAMQKGLMELVFPIRKYIYNSNQY